MDSEIVCLGEGLIEMNQLAEEDPRLFYSGFGGDVSNVAIAIEEDSVPIRPEVNGACEILGLDPLTIANEGRFIAIVASEDAETAVHALQNHPQGSEACIIGEVLEEPEGMVFLRTALGGHRGLDMLVGDPLPRIC